MNSAMKAGFISSKSNNCIYMKSALFHSTPVLDRRRRDYWDARNSYYSKRFRKLRSKQTLLRNVSEYADFIFQSWKDGYDEDGPSSSRGNSWFRKQYSAKDSRWERANNQGSRFWTRRGFQVCGDDDSDMETIFRSAFGGTRFYYWSFTDEEIRWRSSSNYHGRSWNWRRGINEESDSSFENETSESSDTASDRLALGLNSSGPLTLEDVKNAYRTCAVKWHPDRHQGSSKAVAEEKFKLCGAAYQSLCDKLVVN